jgi:hypothetical protein
MKKLLVVLGLLLVATMLFIGCGDTTNTTTAGQLGPQNYDKTGTLQGKIMDAVTNAPIGNDNNSELKIWLIQGTDNRGPSKLINDKNNPLCGEYAFSGIPISFDWNWNSNFKIVVVKPGYQRFEAAITLGSSYDDVSYTDVVIMDNVINYIGNIYLFPEDYRTADKTIRVFDPNWKPIPNALVGVYQNVENNVSPALYGLSINNPEGSFVSRDILNPMGGLYSDMSMTTDTSGTAVISASRLVLGGSYKVMVAPLNFDGQILYDVNYYRTFREYSADVPMIIQLASLSGGSLFATAASNQVPGTITPSGVLSVTFNQPIILSTTFFTATLVSTTSGTVTSPVTAVLSNGDRTITLTPVFTTAAAGAGATVQYGFAGTITLPSTQTVAQCNGSDCTLFNGGGNDVKNITNSLSVSGDVQLITN